MLFVQFMSSLEQQLTLRTYFLSLLLRYCTADSLGSWALQE